MSDHEERLRRLERLAVRMDSAFRIPVIGMRVGWDAIIGLIPGIGDALTFVPAAAIILEARRLGTRSHVLGRMIFNTVLDLVVGGIPILGDLFDAKFKSNRRNVAILRAHLADRGMAAHASPIIGPGTATA